MTIIIETQKKQINIKMSELLYISTITNRPNILCFVTQKKDYYCKGNLTYYDTKYPSLYRCHRSLLVNLRAISEINKKKRIIYFEGTTAKSCFFSRRCSKRLTKEWKYIIIEREEEKRTIQD